MKSAPAFLAAFVMVPAFAQTAREEPSTAQSPQPLAAERPALKLKLDNPASWATVAPEASKEQPGGLPSLGDNARPIPTTPSPTPARTSPYPSEPSPGR
jgi:hypothetical protein